MSLVPKNSNRRSWKVLQIRHPRVPKSNGILNSFGRCPSDLSTHPGTPGRTGCLRFTKLSTGPCFGPETIVEILLVFHDGIRVSWHPHMIRVGCHPQQKLKEPGARGPSFNCSAEKPKPPNSQKPSFEKSSKNKTMKKNPIRPKQKKTSRGESTLVVKTDRFGRKESI